MSFNLRLPRDATFPRPDREYFVPNAPRYRPPLRSAPSAAEMWITAATILTGLALAFCAGFLFAVMWRA